MLLKLTVMTRLFEITIRHLLRSWYQSTVSLCHGIPVRSIGFAVSG